MEATRLSKPAADSQAHQQALRLLQLEAEIRRTGSVTELVHHMANESRAILGFRQAFVLHLRYGRLRVDAVSSISVLDRNAPLVRWVERAARNWNNSKVLKIKASEAGAPDDYPFPFLCWVPLTTVDGRVFAGLLLAAEQPFSDRKVVLSERLAASYSYAWRALTKGRVAMRRPAPSKVAAILLFGTILASIFVRIPITAVAEVEVVGRDPIVMTAPLDGVVNEVVVNPNTPVKAGDLIAMFEDTELRNAAQIARQSVNVARSRVEALSSSAFSDPNARRDIAIARSELELAVAEQDLAEARLKRTELRAPVEGIIILESAADWRGRPAQVGERIVEIADPAKIEFLIRLAVNDLIVLDQLQPIKIFLDSAPLDPRTAILERASYQAVPQADGTLAFELRAKEATSNARAGMDGDKATALPRIGARGTARLIGEDARLGFVMFRRPISWLRQNLGH